MEPITIIMTGIIAILLVLAIVSLIKIGQLKKTIENEKRQELNIEKQLQENRIETLQFLQSSFKNFGSMISENQMQSALNQDKQLESIRNTMEVRLKNLTEDNNAQLEKMRETVDEKLQKTLDDRITQSFKLVNERLQQVYEGLGEMKNLATQVGDVKKVLSGVKTRGILGEVQLGAILEQVLTPDQYLKETVTKPGSTGRVEFAVKFPGQSQDRPVLLPIDSKFPGETYARVMEAYDTGDKTIIAESLKTLENVIKNEAKMIKEKYIAPPYTTDFAVMFLPFEGLYAEVVRMGLLEVLQREYKVNIAGPTTMAALLNSLQMGFRTLAIEKHSSQVWEILGAVKTEFATFEGVLNQTRKRLKQADDELESLIGTRTRAIERKLRGVEALDQERKNQLL